MATLPENFKWIVPNHIAGSASPLADQLKPLKDEGIDVIVSLQQGIRKDLPGYGPSYDLPLYTDADILELGLEYVNFPIVDHQSPTHEQMGAFITLVESNPDKAFLIHCYAGVGRTGTMGAVYLGASLGIDGDDAIDLMHDVFSLYVETSSQSAAVRSFLLAWDSAQFFTRHVQEFVDEADILVDESVEAISNFIDDVFVDDTPLPDEVVEDDVPLD